MKRLIIAAAILVAVVIALQHTYANWVWVGQNLEILGIAAVCAILAWFILKGPIRFGAVAIVAIVTVLILNHGGVSLRPFAAGPYTAAESQPRCNQNLQVVEVGPVPIVINPHGKYFVRWRVEAGGSRVNLIGTGGRILRTVGPEGGNFSEFFESVQAVGGEATFHYLLVTC